MHTPTKAAVADQSNIIYSGFGPMSLDPSCQYFVGATVISNGTAELQAMVEALFFLLSEGLCRRRRVGQEQHICLGDSIILHPDASYVVGLCNNVFAIRENIVLARLVKHLWKVVSRYFMLECYWTKSHAKDEANNYVDRLADLGTQSSYVTSFHSRLSVTSSEWEELDFLASVGAAGSGQLSSCALYLEGKVAVSRSATSAFYERPLGQDWRKMKHGTLEPELPQVTIQYAQSVISSVAAQCGKSNGPRAYRLPDGDVLVLEINDLIPGGEPRGAQLIAWFCQTRFSKFAERYALLNIPKTWIRNCKKEQL